MNLPGSKLASKQNPSSSNPLSQQASAMMMNIPTNLKTNQGIQIQMCDLENIDIMTKDAIAKTIKEGPVATIMHSEAAFQKKPCIDGLIGGCEVTIGIMEMRGASDDVYTMFFDPNEERKPAEPLWRCVNGDHSKEELKKKMTDTGMDPKEADAKMKGAKCMFEGAEYSNINAGKFSGSSRIEALYDLMSNSSSTTLTIVFVDVIWYQKSLLLAFFDRCKQGGIQHVNIIVMDHHVANVDSFHSSLGSIIDGLGLNLSLFHIYTPGIIAGLESSALTGRQFRCIFSLGNNVIGHAPFFAMWSDMLVIMSSGKLPQCVEHCKHIFDKWNIVQDPDANELFHKEFFRSFEEVNNGILQSALIWALAKQDELQGWK